MAEVSSATLASAVPSFTPAASPAYRYFAFGGVIESELELPELARTARTEAARWRLCVEDCAPSAADVRHIGARDVGGERYALAQFSDGFRLSYSHAGVFDISRDGSRIVWYREPDALLELVRAIALGPAIAFALELAGFLCLHGSAVMIGAEGVAFIGPKHHGKSTLATAITARGGRLIGDDLIAATSGSPPRIVPGVASVRLWEDVASALPLSAICDRFISGVKTTATDFTDGAVALDACRLSAVYVLEPVPAEQGATCTRTRLPFGAAAIRLAQQTKLPDALVGLRGAGSQLARAAALAASVPVWVLTVPRDLALLPGTVDQLFDWHREMTP